MHAQAIYHNCLSNSSSASVVLLRETNIYKCFYFSYRKLSVIAAIWKCVYKWNDDVMLFSLAALLRLMEWDIILPWFSFG